MNIQTNVSKAAAGSANPLELLAHSALDPLFVRASRTGVPSAWYGHVPFARWIVSAVRPRCIVELGTHNGVSYAAFCDAVIDAGLDARCYAVDTWRGDDHAGYYGEEVFADLQTFHDSRYAAFSKMVRSTFDQACDHFQDGSIDLLHIDGQHTYEAVAHDFAAWRPKLSSRAVVLLHDTNVRERDFGVWRFWEELRETYPGFEFLHAYGLGVLAFGTDVPDAVRGLCEVAEPSLIAKIRERFAVSGQRCVLDSEAVQLRHEAQQAREFAQAEANRANELVQAETNRANELVQAETNRANEVIQAATAERDKTQKELSRLATVARAKERVDAPTRIALAETRGLLDEARRRQKQTDAQMALLRDQVHSLAYELQNVHQSTAWKMTYPVRRSAARLPAPLRRIGRLAVKATYWAATPARIPARLRARRNAHDVNPEVPGEVSLIAPVPAAPADRFSLEHIPPLPGDYGAALDWYDPDEPDVSIVVLNWNRSDMTLLCLQHIWQRTVDYRYEVIVVDNGSSDADVANLRAGAPFARIIALGANRFFGEANNLGVEAARGRYVCLLNNDAFVHPGWLKPLVRILEDKPDAGAVGPRFLYPDGRLQEAGGMINRDGSVTQCGKGEAPDELRHHIQRQVDYVSAACILLRRSDFLRVLGFDLTWDPAYYEDVDLCLKLRLIGLHTFYCPEATVTHIENATSSGELSTLQLDNIVEINRIKLLSRWQDFFNSLGALVPDLIPPSPEAVPSVPGMPRVLIYTPYNLTPGGGERYILTIAEAFRGAADVSLVTPDPFSRTRILTMGRDLGIRVDHIEVFGLRDIYSHPPYDLAFVLGNTVFPPIGRLATHCVYICQFPFPITDPVHADHLRPFWNDYDLIVTYSDFVRRHANAVIASLALPERPIKTLSPPVPLLPLSRAKRPQILHVGRFFAGGHCKRQDAMIEALRMLVQQGVATELHLAGSLHPEPEHRAYYLSLLERAAGLPVHFHVNCSPQTLHMLYRDSQIYWHATGFDHDLEMEPQAAEHFGISVVEAMSAGCIPIVFSAGGPAGIVEDGVTGFHFLTLDELYSRTRSLLEEASQDVLEALATAAAHAAQSYGETGFRTQVRELASRFIITGADVSSHQPLR